jgi:hypothetical protein
LTFDLQTCDSCVVMTPLDEVQAMAMEAVMAVPPVPVAHWHFLLT